MKTNQFFNAEKFNLKATETVPAKKSIDIKSSPIGIGFEVLDRKVFDPEPVYAELAELGAKWARCQTGWARCETQKGVYDFQWLDDIADNLLAIGITPWFSLSYGNMLYSPDSQRLNYIVPTDEGPEATEAWQNYVAAVVDHFKDRIDHWELWNEPNGPCFVSPEKRGSAGYMELIKATVPIIKQHHPAAKVLGLPAACNRINAFPFIYECLEMGIANYIDIISFHPYRHVPELNYRKELEALRGFLKRTNSSSLRLWQGEHGFPSTYKGNDSWWAKELKASEEIQAKCLTRRLILDLAMGIEMTEYFHAVDFIDGRYVTTNGATEIHMGILDSDNNNRRKLAFKAMQCVCSLFDSQTILDDFLFLSEPSVEVRLRSTLIEQSTMHFSFLRRNIPMAVYYSAENAQMEQPVRTVNVRIHSRSDLAELKDPVLVDTVRNTVYDLNGHIGHSGKVGDLIFDPGKTDSELNAKCNDFDLSGYYHFLNLPLTNYPLIITDRKALI